MNSTTTRTERLTLSIDGMTCGHCVHAVTKALAGLSTVNVRSVTVGMAEIETTSSNAANEAIEALDATGYLARVASRGAAPLPSARTGGCCGGPKACCG